jgi:ATP-binding cassette subfamily C protein CydCD
MFPNSRLLQLARKSLPWLILTISIGFLSGVLTILQARSVSQIVNQVFLESQDLPGVKGLLQLTLALFTARAILAWGSSLSAKTIAIQVKSRVRKVLLDKLEELGPAYLQGEQSGEISNTVIEGVEALDAYFSQYLPQLVLSALVPLTILFFVFPRDVLSGFVMLVTAPLIPFFMYLVGSQAKIITDKQYSTLSRLAANFLDSLQGLKTLKLYNRAKAQTEKIRESSDQYRKTTMKVLQITFLSALVLELLATLSTAVVAVEIGLRLLYYRVSFEQALFLLIIAPEFYIPLRMLGLRFHAGMEGQSAADRIFQILDQEALVKSRSQHPINPPQPEFQKLAFKDVSFSYPGERGQALSEISFQIKGGEQIALVGASGAGKSTLASLLLGFFPPEEGQILIDGSNLTELDLKEWRNQIAWVPQKPKLFQGTIADNIRLAQPAASAGAVPAAASAAHLADFIEGLPEGYQTRIGEGGARLSGGQAQRLALARAFLKDAPILLLDEPTSQLDPVTESQLADATRALMAGRTVITIAHRLNTVFQADRILVLQKGHIVESGSHQELIAQGKYYRDLVRAYTGYQAVDPAELLDEQHLTHLPLSASPEWNPATTQPHPPSPILSGAQPSRKTAYVHRLLSFFKPYLREVLASAALGTLTIASSVALMGASAWIISMAALHPNVAVLQVAIVGVRTFGISRGISRYLERLVSHNLTFKILTRLRVWFYESLVPLAPARIMDFRAGDLLSRITSDIKTLEDFYIRSIAPPIVAVLIGIGTGIFLAQYQPILGLVLGGLFLVSGLIIPILIRWLARKPGQALVESRTELSGNLLDFVGGLPDLMVFGQTAQKLDQIRRLDRKYHQAQLRLSRVSGLNAGLLIFFSNLGMWLVMVLAIPLIHSGELPGVMLAALALITLSAFEAVQSLPQAMETLSSSLASGERLFEVLDAEPAVIDPEVPQSFPSRIAIQSKHLAFTYPGSPVPALKAIDFVIREGKTIAIVGPSGSGKTTLGNLLLRFWGGYQGEIIVGEKGIPLNSLAQEDIREHISVISQGDALFQDTIRYNIALGNPGAQLKDIIRAAEKAHIHDLIQGLPDGYDTQVGERAQGFSAGEAQRISIARAVLKDAPLFLLDEPTANLDPVTEKAILETLFGILRDKTAILITHRLAGLENADQILVLVGGEIVERGTQAELLSQNGVYRSMWVTQNRILTY